MPAWSLGMHCACKKADPSWSMVPSLPNKPQQLTLLVPFTFHSHRALIALTLMQQAVGNLPRVLAMLQHLPVDKGWRCHSSLSSPNSDPLFSSPSLFYYSLPPFSPCSPSTWSSNLPPRFSFWALMQSTSLPSSLALPLSSRSPFPSLSFSLISHEGG